MTISTLLPRFRSDRRAATAMIFALSVVPLTLMASFAIDFTSALSERARLKAASDAALLTATQSALAIYKNNALATSFQAAKDDGIARFNAQFGTSVSAPVSSTSINITRTNGKFVTQVHYDYAYPVMLSALLSHSSIPMDGDSEMTVTVDNYVDIHLVMDTSESMFVGADATTQAAMVTATQNANAAYPADDSWKKAGCAFACHWDPGNNDYYNLAQVKGSMTRFDQMKAATQAMATLLNSRNAGGFYQLGLYTFTEDAPYAVYIDSDYGVPHYKTPNYDYGLSSQILTMGANAAGLTPDLVDPWHAFNTDITSSLRDFGANVLVKAGDGSTRPLARKYVVILTDGIDNKQCLGSYTAPSGTTYQCDQAGRIETPMDPTSCDFMKTVQNATVVVIHTDPWIPGSPGPSYFQAQSDAQNNLKLCASNPTLYYSVSNLNQITAALTAVIDLATGNGATFTQ